MEQDGNFKYFTGQETMQFAFVPVPMALLRDTRYENLSSDAKLLYALLLNRMNLSRKNQWFDEENRVFICYSIEDIAADLHCGRNKAIKALQELDTERGIGLVEKNRRGQGKGSILYVKNFYTEEGEEQKFTNQTSEENEGDSEVYISNFKRFTNQTSRSPKGKLLEVPNHDSKNNKNNNINVINNDSNPIISAGAGAPVADKPIGCDIDEMVAYSEIIKENIEYDALMERYPYEQKLVEGIFELILETVLVKGDTVLIESNQYPRELVKSKFLKLDFTHIEYVMGCFKSNTTKVNNIKKYLLATLFNAPSTIDGYYQAEVNHDFPQYASSSY